MKTYRRLQAEVVTRDLFAHSAVESQAFFSKMGYVKVMQANSAHEEAEPFDCQLEYVL